MRVDIPVGIYYAAVEEDGTSSLVIEVFDDLNKVGADVAVSYTHLTLPTNAEV